MSDFKAKENDKMEIHNWDFKKANENQEKR